MNLFPYLKLARRSTVIALMMISSGVIADEITSSSNQPVETMPDGNLRDAAPTAETIAQLGRQSLHNMIAFKSANFEMGDWGEQVNEEHLPFDGSVDSKPLHKVDLSKFSISKYPVTYAEFDIFTAALRLPRINQSTVVQKYRKPNNPAGVTWEGANDYCHWLGKITNRQISLPTEAQWEFSARSGGKRYVYPTDNGEREMGRNLPDYDQRQNAGGLTSVGDFPPNLAGIYYMSANVHEWVSDWYSADYYKNSPKSDPKGPLTGTKHVVRGNFGDGGSEMTFKRWSLVETPQKPWTKYANAPGEITREIPPTKYSDYAYSAFRCALN